MQENQIREMMRVDIAYNIKQIKERKVLFFLDNKSKKTYHRKNNNLSTQKKKKED